MRTAQGFALAAVSTALLLCGRAQAEPRIGIEGWGGWNRHSMTDVNETLRSFNDEYRTALPPIRNGSSWGLGLRSWPHENVLIRFGFERLTAQTQDSGVEFDLGAHAITLGATGFLPSSGRIRCGAGLGLGAVLAKGGLVARGASLGSSGSGFNGHVTGEAAVAIGLGYSLAGVIGLRSASIRGLKFEDSASDLSPQYSGLFVRVGLALDARPKN